jgi:hypothetical protein
MRFRIASALAILPMLIACGAKPAPRASQPSTVESMPEEELDVTTTRQFMGVGFGDLDATINLEPEIVDAWTGVKILVIDNDASDEQTFDVMLGETELLGDSGLTIAVDTFVPDFTMDQNGIRSRSAHTDNPAARVRITEDGGSEFQGWLFSAMPEIHPFEHPRYQVLLVEGIPVG